MTIFSADPAPLCAAAIRNCDFMAAKVRIIGFPQIQYVCIPKA
jgi:hypothetical protein